MFGEKFQRKYALTDQGVQQYQKREPSGQLSSTWSSWAASASCT